MGVADLFDRRLRFELTPEITIDGHSAAHRVQGKPRIRLEDQQHRHAYRLLAAALLLPQPKRELRATATGPDFIRDGQYSITDIDVDVASVAPGAVDLRPTTVWLGNSTGLARYVNVALRMALVQSVWDAGRSQATPLGELVKAHESAVATGDHKAMEAAAADLRRFLGSDGDILDELTARLGVEGSDTAVSSTTGEVPLEPVEDETDPADAARRAVAQWRRSVVRSAQGRAFSARVRSAYSHRCALSGDVLPKLPHTASPGVDGAHILPWARYELNTLRNGICLNKLCHWAFDAGVIRIDFAEASGEYIVSIPDQVETEAIPRGMTLGYFENLAGPVPEERLPADTGSHPSPAYLAQLNEEMFGAAA